MNLLRLLCPRLLTNHSPKNSYLRPAPTRNQRLIVEQRFVILGPRVFLKHGPKFPHWIDLFFPVDADKNPTVNQGLVNLQKIIVNYRRIELLKRSYVHNSAKKPVRLFLWCAKTNTGPINGFARQCYGQLREKMAQNQKSDWHGFRKVYYAILCGWMSI